MFTKPSLTELDILRETANIGAGNAATALSKLLGAKVRMCIPDVRIVPFYQLSETVGGTEAAVMAVYFRLQGDFSGSMFVVMKEEAAQQLLSHLLGQPLRQSDSSMGCSALAEVGNIVAGTYLSALSDFTGLKLFPSVPHLTLDMAGAVLNVGVAEIGVSADEALMVVTEIFVGDFSANTHVLMLPQPDHLAVLFKTLGVSDYGR